MDGRRERLELVVADLQSGKVQPVDHATARDRIEKRIRDRRTRCARSSSTGTLTLWRTRLEVVPRNKSARKRWPCVLMATRSQPFCSTHLTISSAGSP